MKYFFIAYAIIGLLVFGVFHNLGSSSKPPIVLLPDMDDQDKLKPQKEDAFFANRQGARLPVAGTVSLGHSPEGSAEEDLTGLGYYNTGVIGTHYGTGMPKELNLTKENAAAFIREGQERFNINCAICHGRSGDGAGIVAQYGVPGVANLTMFPAETYPDGRLFSVITNGKGNMGSYKHNVNVRDRWAIIAYVRTLQAARKAPYEQVKESFDKAKAAGLVK